MTAISVRIVRRPSEALRQIPSAPSPAHVSISELHPKSGTDATDCVRSMYESESGRRARPSVIMRSFFPLAAPSISCSTVWPSLAQCWQVLASSFQLLITVPRIPKLDDLRSAGTWQKVTRNKLWGTWQPSAVEIFPRIFLSGNLLYHRELSGGVCTCVCTLHMNELVQQLRSLMLSQTRRRWATVFTPALP